MTSLAPLQLNQIEISTGNNVRNPKNFSPQNVMIESPVNCLWVWVLDSSATDVLVPIWNVVIDAENLNYVRQFDV